MKRNEILDFIICKMRKIYFLVILMLLSGIINAQIGGLSAGKLGTFCSGTVPYTKIEFEPSFSVGFGDSYFDNNGKAINLFDAPDSLSFYNSMAFRLTYGVFENAEIGILSSPDLSGLQSGFKWKFLEKGASSLGLMLGANLNFNNQIHEKEIASYLGGLVYSLDKAYSIDANITYGFSQAAETSLKHHDLFLSADFGHYFENKLQPVVGFYYSQTFFDNTDLNQNNLYVSPGFTLEKATNFILVLNYMYPVLGQNVEQIKSINLALTILID